MKVYTAKSAGQLLSIAGRDVAKLAIRFSRGRKVKDFWWFDATDLDFFRAVLAYRRNPHKDENVKEMKKYFKWPNRLNNKRIKRGK